MARNIPKKQSKEKSKSPNRSKPSTTGYNHEKIEKKWQNVWAKTKAFRADDKSKKQKFYGLIEFPFASGEGLHVGHVRSNTAMDIIARKRRAEGFNVMYPIGWDSFGLPTENYAIKTGIHPSILTKKNTSNFKRQLKAIGFSFDWEREVDTSDPKYYKWTQWIFLEMFKRGLAYQALTEVWWCEALGTVLANEEVIDGKSERGDHPCVRMPLSQWMLAITKYADRLHDDLDTVDYLPKIKTQQKNWIGRSEGAELTFKVKAAGIKLDDLKVFTTRPDTIFGVTYVVIAPEHSLIDKLRAQGGVRLVKNWDMVESYVSDSKKKSNIDRSEAKEKTGIELKGVRAVNPANGDEVSVWIADYVLADYGTGAVMAVPAHDERDFEFAKNNNLQIKEVIIPSVVDHTNPPREGKNTKTRKTVHAIVYNPARKAYLTFKSRKFHWDTVIIGGVEEGEDPVQAALREVKEETGYTDLVFKKILGGPIKASYFATHKDENRVAITTGVYFEMNSEAQVSISEEEKNAENDIVWRDPKDFVPGKMVNSELPFWLERLSSEVDVPYTGEGVLMNSARWDGLDSEKIKQQITESVGGTWVSKFKLRDWVFSRQRYWGEPFPIVWVDKASYELAKSQTSSAIINLLPEKPVIKSTGPETLYALPIPPKLLPVTLPNVKSFAPSGDGKSALGKAEKWVNVWLNVKTGETKSVKPKSGPWVKGLRETDTMPNWAGSSWYYLRYIDPKNPKELASKTKLSKWLPVDWYNGGMEHTTLHLLYSRFWHKFLYDIKIVPTPEPYTKRTSHGLILGEGGAKMSKSLGNIVNPDDIIKVFGADTLRVYEMFMGPFDEAVAWSTDSIVGSRRFIERVWKLREKVNTQQKHINDRNTESLLHKTIRKVSDDIETMRFNTAISTLMILTNELEKKEVIPSSAYQILVKLVSPFAPHVSEELWSLCGNKNSIHVEPWPSYDESKMGDELVKIVVQVMGKVRAVIEVPKDTEEAKIIATAKANSEVLKWIESKEIVKVVYVPGRVVNLVVKG